MKLSICLTIALTALSVAAAPFIRSPVHLQERGSVGPVAGAFKAVSKVAPKPPHGNPAPHRSSRKPLRLALHKPLRLALNKPSPPALNKLSPPAPPKPLGPPGPAKLPTQQQAQPKPRPAPPKPRPAPPKVRPAPPRPRPAPQHSNSNPLSSIGNLIGDAASALVPHFDLGDLF